MVVVAIGDNADDGVGNGGGDGDGHGDSGGGDCGDSRRSSILRQRRGWRRGNQLANPAGV